MVNLKDRSEDTMRTVYDTETIDRRGSTAQKLFCTATAFFLLLGAATSALAQTAFEGSLNNVTITDAAGTNSPPTSNFVYSQDGDTFTFDASSSSDSDGTIAKYRWEFGDGTSIEGATSSYTNTDSVSFPVTLTVVDNNNGTTLSQKMIVPTTIGVSDIFSTDTQGDYTILKGGLNIYDGTAHANGAWATTFAIHNKDLASSDHAIQADIYTDGASATGGLLFRINKSQNTGYLASFSGGRIALSSYSAGVKTWLNQYDGNFTVGVYSLRAEIVATFIKIYVNDKLVLQTTNNKYTTGNSVGLYIEPYGKDALITVDNLKSE